MTRRRPDVAAMAALPSLCAVLACTPVYHVHADAGARDGSDAPSVGRLVDDCCHAIGLRLNEELPGSQSKTWWAESIEEQPELFQICHGRAVRIWAYATADGFVTHVLGDTPGIDAKPVASDFESCLAARHSGIDVTVERRWAPDLR